MDCQHRVADCYRHSCPQAERRQGYKHREGKTAYSIKISRVIQKLTYALRAYTNVWPMSISYRFLNVCRLVRSLLEDKPRVTRFPIEWDELPQIPTIGGLQIGDENQPPMENQADNTMEEDVGFQKQTMEGFAQPSDAFNQTLGFQGSFNHGFQNQPPVGLIEQGSAMEE